VDGGSHIFQGQTEAWVVGPVQPSVIISLILHFNWLASLQVGCSPKAKREFRYKSRKAGIIIIPFSFLSNNSPLFELAQIKKLING
jgi:hypothetical protein